MTNLKKEHITFIDTYLENSNIIFTDIRLEMVDHVATAIETQIETGDTRDFYFIFKDYMVKNKSALLFQNRKFTSTVDKAIGKKWIKNCLSLKGLLILVFSFAVIFLLHLYFVDLEFLSVVKHIPLFVLIVTVGLYFMYIKKKNKRYSALERIPFYFLVTYYVTNFSIKIGSRYSGFLIESAFVTILIASFFITLFATLLYTAFEYRKEYDFRFNNLI
ncbi:hypothetical protein [uncultured Winogradskyella sp.]|uniref:hypothetical protein n=1 Tax=uncultured Winogradskyella sp. TaxID=395353 RepID=UPI0030D72731|tara:strand:+ start:70 stop:723 length:654 start_codon:yes stop_codon:yes gene_type:complete